jgi:sulfide:quinone oxidoreductase
MAADRPTARVVVLGAGFGGLEVASRLSETFGTGIDVTIVDRSDSFVFGFSKLDVMFGRHRPDDVRHHYSEIAKPGVRLVQSDIRTIDPLSRRVVTDEQTLDCDHLVVALGADLHPEMTPGLLDGGHEFYTTAGAFALAEVLDSFAGGRIIIAVTSTPFKCPPAPSETALLMDEYLRDRQLRDRSTIALIMPLGTPVPPSPAASSALLAAFAQRDIEWVPERTVTSLDPQRRVAFTSDGSEYEYDLFLGVPVHHAPQVVVDAGLTREGWIPVDPFTLETAFPDVYAVGDVTSVGTPKAGVFAEGQAAVVAARIASRINAGNQQMTYDGHGTCYFEFGRGEIAKVDVTFRPGQRPDGRLEGPSRALAAEKAEFASSRVARWFDSH